MAMAEMSVAVKRPTRGALADAGPGSNDKGYEEDSLDEATGNFLTMFG